MKFTELKKHIADGKYAGGYILTGDDAFVISSALSKLKSLVGAFPEFNVSELYENAEQSKIIEALNMFPISSRYRLVILYEYKGDVSKIVGYLKNPAPECILVVVAPRLTENLSKIVPLLTPIDCNRVSVGDIKKFLAYSAKDENVTLLDNAATLLCEYTKRDMSRITTEFKKLASYAGQGGTVDVAAVEELVTPDEDYRIFELSEAVATRKKERAAEILKRLLEQKTAPSTLLSMLYSHFRRLLYISVNKNDPELSSLLGVKEYAVTKSRPQAAMYSAKRLKSICDELSGFDRDFKAGKISDDAALELGIMSILCV